MWSHDFYGCIYQLKSYCIRLLNENKNFEWNYKNYRKAKLFNRYWSFWKKQNKTKEKPKSLNELTITESKTNYWIDMSLLYKHATIASKIFAWRK